MHSAHGSANIAFGHAAISRNSESSRVCAALIRGDEDINVRIKLEEKVPETTSDRFYGRYIDAIILDEQVFVVVASATFIIDATGEYHYILANEFAIEKLDVVDISNLATHIDGIRSDKSVGAYMTRILLEGEQVE